MNLDRNKLHVRWFHFVQSKIGDQNKYRYGTNLCHFMRVTILWGAFIVAVLAAMVGGVIAFFIVLPYSINGFLGIALWWAAVGAVFGSIHGAAFLIGRYGKKFAPIGSMAHCVYQHAKAVKGRFCPIVTFDNQSLKRAA